MLRCTVSSSNSSPAPIELRCAERLENPLHSPAAGIIFDYCAHLSDLGWASMKRIRVFVGSSSESLPIAQAVKARLEAAVSPSLEGNIEVDLWNQTFGPGKYAIDSLESSAKQSDFAILVFGPDDIVLSRGARSLTPRDNVLIELGLFLGHLGRERTFFLVNNQDATKIPSDLAGITYETYRARDDNKYEAAVATACDHFLATIEETGRFRHPNKEVETKFREAIANCRNAFKVEHSAFESILKKWVENFKDDSEDFGRGILKIRFDYNFFLTEMFRNANSEIFSTTIPEYFQVWERPLGKRLLQCQNQNNKAVSTRVFIFSAQDEITPNNMKVMQDHANNNVEVRVFIDDAAEFSYAPDRTERDWTMIDGGVAIGVTKNMGKIYEAHWFFRDLGKVDEYLRLKDNLYHSSLPLQKIMIKSAA